MTRFIVEGEWSGYVSSQQRVVHREVISEWRAKRLSKLHGIRYSDGTMLTLFVRRCKPREKVAEVMGYKSLISDAQWLDGPILDVRTMEDQLKARFNPAPLADARALLAGREDV